MHRVDMTARSFKFAINDFLKALFTIPLPALEVEKTFNNTSPLTPALANAGRLKRGGKHRPDQGLQTGLYCLPIPCLGSHVVD